jgi:alginate O-acetyltransferase complex protein AlgI
MVFSSHIFIYYFLPFSLLLYYVVGPSFRLVALTLLSYLFYAWATPWYVFILLWSTCVDFCCGNLIYGHWQPLGWRGDIHGNPNPPQFQRKVSLALSLLNSLGMLFAFKYFAFAQTNLNAMRSMLGMEPLGILRFVLPVGISFYTFESISYVVDIYKGRAKSSSATAFHHAASARQIPPGGHTTLAVELRGFVNFACYLAQFPHLVAGPIIRYQDLEPQMFRRRHSLQKFARGIVFFCVGFAKKILLADTMGQVADYAFNGRPAVWSDAWFGLFAYAFQIYFDFSGYSDMAIGLGLFFGFDFLKNFDSPYKSASITEFWRRWHISLSTWLRDYLYITLGGNRRGKARTYLNLFIVMFLGGLWHGASWTFAIWGTIHGLWLALERLLSRRSIAWAAPRFVRVALTFLIVCLAWVFFRSPNLAAAMNYLFTLFRLDTFASGTIKLAHLGMWTYPHVVCLLIAAILAFRGIQTWDMAKRVTPLTALFALAVFAASLLVFAMRSVTPFLYFRF